MNSIRKTRGLRQLFCLGIQLLTHYSIFMMKNTGFVLEGFLSPGSIALPRSYNLFSFFSYLFKYSFFTMNNSLYCLKENILYMSLLTFLLLGLARVLINPAPSVSLSVSPSVRQWQKFSYFPPLVFSDFLHQVSLK